MSKKFILPLVLMMALAGCATPSTSTSEPAPEGSSSSVNEPVQGETITPSEAMAIGSALAADETTTETYKVEGEVASIKYAWDDQYQNISFFVGELLVYRVKMGTGINYTDIAPGVKVVCEGKLQNYKGDTVELVSGYVISLEKNGQSGGGDQGGETPTPSGTITPAEAMAIGTALGKDETTSESYKVAGKITGFKEQYNEQYKNVSFYMDDLLVYRAKLASNVTPSQIVQGADVVVEGPIQNYYGNTVEMVQSTVISATGGNGGSTGGDQGGSTGGEVGGETTGAHSITFDFAAAKSQVAAYDASLKDQVQEITVGDYDYTTINCYNSSNTPALMLGSKKYVSPSLVALAEAIPGAITEVVITFPQGSSANADYNVTFSTSATTAPVTSGTFKVAGVTDAAQTLTFKNTVAGATYFALSCVNTKYNGQITSIVVYYN